MLPRFGILLIALWLLALVNSYTMGGFAHLLGVAGLFILALMFLTRSVAKPIAVPAPKKTPEVKPEGPGAP